MSWMFEYVQDGGCLQYEKLGAAIRQRGTGLAEFVETFPHPFLIGGDIYKSFVSNADNLARGSGKLTDTATRRILFDFKSSAGLGGMRKAIPERQRQCGADQHVYALKMRPSEEYQDSLTASIGKHADNDVVIQDPTVSRQHAQILFTGGRYFVQDLYSTNGTKVSYRDIEPSQLAPIMPNMHISFGCVVFVILPSNLFMGKLAYDEV